MRILVRSSLILKMVTRRVWPRAASGFFKTAGAAIAMIVPPSGKRPSLRGSALHAVQVAAVDHVEVLVPGGVAEPPLRDAAEQRHLAAFKHRRRHLGAGAGPLPLGAAGRGLAHARADAAANAFLPRPLIDANVNAG